MCGAVAAGWPESTSTDGISSAGSIVARYLRTRGPSRAGRLQRIGRDTCGSRRPRDRELAGDRPRAGLLGEPTNPGASARCPQLMPS